MASSLLSHKMAPMAHGPRSPLQVKQNVAVAFMIAFAVLLLYHFWGLAYASDGEVTDGDRLQLLIWMVVFVVFCFGARAVISWKPPPPDAPVREPRERAKPDDRRINREHVIILTSLAAGWGAACYWLWRNDLRDHPLQSGETDVGGWLMLSMWTVLNLGNVIILVHGTRKRRREAEAKKRSSISMPSAPEPPAPVASSEAQPPVADPRSKPLPLAFLIVFGTGLSLVMWGAKANSDGKVGPEDANSGVTLVLTLGLIFSFLIAGDTRRRRWELGEHPASPGYRKRQAAERAANQDG